MIEANVTEEQLSDANEPEFSAALDARREVREHAETDPADYRAQEEAVLAGARAGAEDVAVTQLEGMHGARVETLGAVIGKKDDDEERRPARGARTSTQGSSTSTRGRRPT